MIEARRLFGALLALLVLALGFTVLRGYHTMVDLQAPWPDDPGLYPPSTQASVSGDTIRFGVISRYPSNILYQGYQPILDYLSAQTGHHFILRPGESYEATVEQLVRGEVDVAFLGSLLYVQASEDHGIVSILQPLNERGEPEFRSVLIARDPSDLETLADLAGRRLALPSELSFSANWLTLSELGLAGMTPDDFEEVRHFPFHQSVVYEVIRGPFDAGVVRERVAQEFADRGIRILLASDPIPGTPVVVRRDQNPDFVQALIRILTSIDPTDPKTAEMLSTWDPEFAHGFIEARDEDYDVIRALLRGTGR
jgi:phosphonate transport system substrate-binding protein